MLCSDNLQLKIFSLVTVIAFNSDSWMGLCKLSEIFDVFQRFMTQFLIYICMYIYIYAYICIHTSLESSEPTGKDHLPPGISWNMSPKPGHELRHEAGWV